MQEIEPGHAYALTERWGGELAEGDRGEQMLRFPRNDGSGRAMHGVTVQEVLRVLIARTQYCQRCLPCEETRQIIQHLRVALVLHEARALRRKVEKAELAPEVLAVNTDDGHIRLTDGEGKVV